MKTNKTMWTAALTMVLTFVLAVTAIGSAMAETVTTDGTYVQANVAQVAQATTYTETVIDAAGKRIDFELGNPKKIRMNDEVYTVEITSATNEGFVVDIDGFTQMIPNQYGNVQGEAAGVFFVVTDADYGNNYAKATLWFVTATPKYTIELNGGAQMIDAPWFDAAVGFVDFAEYPESYPSTPTKAVLEVRGGQFAEQIAVGEGERFSSTIGKIVISGSVFDEFLTTIPQLDGSVTFTADPGYKYVAQDNEIMLYADEPRTLRYKDSDYHVYELVRSSVSEKGSVTLKIDGTPIAVQSGGTYRYDGVTFHVASIVKSGDVYAKLYFSDHLDNELFLELNDPQTITMNGQTYEIEIVGADPNDHTIVLSVNGDRDTVKEGESRTLGGISVYAHDVFVTSIPKLDASATIIVLPGDSGGNGYPGPGGSGGVESSDAITVRPKSVQAVRAQDIQYAVEYPTSGVDAPGTNMPYPDEDQTGPSTSPGSTVTGGNTDDVDIECDGCMTEEGCATVGLRLKENGKAIYCDADGNLKPQVTDGTSCTSDSECLSNNCENSVCTTPSQLQKRTVLQVIARWFSGLF